LGAGRTPYGVRRKLRSALASQILQLEIARFEDATTHRRAILIFTCNLHCVDVENIRGCEVSF
jgi:hypothetical protein